MLKIKDHISAHARRMKNQYPKKSTPGCLESCIINRVRQKFLNTKKNKITLHQKTDLNQFSTLLDYLIV